MDAIGDQISNALPLYGSGESKLLGHDRGSAPYAIGICR